MLPWLSTHSALLILLCVSVHTRYLLLLRVCIVSGDAERAGTVLRDMSEDVLLPSREAWDVLAEWFGSGHTQHQWNIIHGRCSSAIKFQLHSTAHMRPQ